MHLLRKTKALGSGLAHAVFVPLALLGSAVPAHAVDGCQLLLCLAGSWNKPPQAAMCVPTVKQAFRDIARGHSWPTCHMSRGNTNNTAWQWATQATCPPFYSLFDPESGHWAGCSYAGLVNVNVSGAWWQTVYVNPYSGDTSTHYSDAARAALTQNGGHIDPTYDRDAAAYRPPPPPCSDCGSSGGWD